MEQTEGTWRAVSPVPPPQDRQIKIVANIVDRDEWSTSVEPYEGLACWSEERRDWLDEFGMSIRGFFESDLVILEWSEANAERRFVLIEEGKLTRVAPRRPAIGALPAPAWHTTDPWAGRNEPGFRAWTDALSSAQLFELLEIQGRFLRALCKLSDWGEWNPATRRCEELPVLESGALDRHMPEKERTGMWMAAKAMEARLEQLLLNRYREELQKRSCASAKAALTRRTRKVHEGLSAHVSEPFRRTGR